MSMPIKDGVFLWQDEASCGGKETSLFFDDEKAAKRICAACPVIADCLEAALVYNYEGVWGGTTARERKRKYRTTVKYLREDYQESGIYNPVLRA